LKAVLARLFTWTAHRPHETRTPVSFCRGLS
jgi:hypothetical protein